ncbi:MAG: FAD binding domain-containing protein, partial [Longimicrobiales bacterium]
RADDVATALREVVGNGASTFIAGGTNLIDLMKEHVERPTLLIDINHLPFDEIASSARGTLRIGALVKNTDVAYDEQVQRTYPLLSKAILAGASAQLRNMATVGGNLMQRTRCSYFYDVATPCNKREPAAGCSAIAGFNKNHAILGTSEHCIATHPSDMCVALAALDAVVCVTNSRGDERQIPFADFHRLPEDAPHIDTNLRRDEIITAVELPAEGFSAHHAYLKIRERTSYAFALVSVAAALELDGGTVREVRLALGGVAHKPWRDPEAEALLRGKRITPENCSRVADALLRDARGFGHNDFKIELAKRAIVRALYEAAGARGSGRAASGRLRSAAESQPRRAGEEMV